MTSWQWIFLRLYMMTLGRMALFAELLRKFLVFRLIHAKKASAYHASSRFFCIKDLLAIAEKEQTTKEGK